MILKRPDIVTDIRKRTGFYKASCEDFVNALEEMILERLSEAEIDDDVEIHLAKGLVIGSHRIPEHTAKNPQDLSDIVVEERNLPYARFTNTFREKIR